MPNGTTTLPVRHQWRTKMTRKHLSSYIVAAEIGPFSKYIHQHQKEQGREGDNNTYT